MDSKELNKRLIKFIEGCKEKGYPLDELCLVPAYPGINDSSYDVQVKGGWLSQTICSDALEILIDILFDTTDVETRTNIFCIKILNKNEVVSCQSDSVERLQLES